MSNRYDRRAKVVDLFKEEDYLARPCGVEITRRFVGEDYLRVVDKSTGHGDALLAAGEFMGIPVGFVESRQDRG